VKRAPPFAFFWLHWAKWPVGVVDVALASALARSGVSVGEVAVIVAAVSLAFSLEFLWAPIIDASATRRRWYVLGVTLMCTSLAAMFLVPWSSATVPLLTGLTFTSCCGAGIALVAVKGVMAYEVSSAQMGRASGFYTAGGIFAGAASGAGTLWLLTHVTNRPLVAALSVGAAALASTAIALASSATPAPRHNLPAELLAALRDFWNFIRTRTGVLIAVLCVIPFGTGTHLLNAIAKEWSVSSDQLAAWSSFAAALGILGAILAGRLSARLGPWRTYIVLGWLMIFMLSLLAITPRAPLAFVALTSLHAAGSGGCYAAALGLVMSSIGKGAASTKAAVLWSLFNFAGAYPALVDGHVHDHMGSTAMLLTHAGMDAGGFGILLLLASRLRVSLRSRAPASAAAL
jgi:MFS transporter, PAT family, beta-lactamase induction signal transducer AmpG